MSADAKTVAQRSGPVGARRRRPRLFVNQAAATGTGRVRRATDMILLVACGLGLALLGALEEPQPGIQRAFLRFVAAIPSGLGGLWRLMSGLLLVLAVGLLLAVAGTRRWGLLRDLVLAAAIALGVSLLAGRIATGSWPLVWDSLRSAGSSPYFPPLGLAVPAAVTVTASPHLTKPARRLGRWVLTLAFVGIVFGQHATPTGAVAGVLVAGLSAAAVHLLLGSTLGRPSLDDVASALARLGIGAHDLGAAERQAAGVFTVDATDPTGHPLVVKVYGRDAHDTQLVTSVWRTIWYREAGAPAWFGRRQQAEHEALLTLLAAQGRVPTQAVVTASETPEKDVVLVLRRAGAPLDTVPQCWDADVVARAWRTLRQLHDLGIAHGQLDGEHLILDGGEIGLIDFRGAVTAPSPDRLRSDQAQLLVTTALAVGSDAAVDAVRVALDEEELAATLPFVQTSALTVHQRRAVRSVKFDLDGLRRTVAERAEITVPELQRMRRVTVSSLLQIALLVVAFFLLASGVGGLDFELLGREVRDATWWLVIAGAILAQTPRVTSALSVMGASPNPLPLAPVYALQLATSYISLAVPTSAARIAVNIRFFQRYGLPPGSALAVGALDGLGQFGVQLLLLLGILLLTPLSLDLDFRNAAPSGLGTLLLIVLLIAAAAVITLAVLPTWRRRIVGFLVQLVRDGIGAARGLQSPRRLLLLLGGNLATELLFALSLVVFVRSIGFHVGLAEVVLINVSVSLLSGLIPVPGGIGVVEGGLTYGLVRAGVPEEAAFAAVLMYRLATFYLPPIWGFFALRWLERNKHL